MGRYYFLAVPVPETICRSLGQEADLLKKRWTYRKWTGYGDYHITLHFFGSLGPQQLERVQVLSAEIAAKHRAFHLTLSGPDSFGSERHPRVIFFGTGASDPLTHLHGDLTCSLNESGFRTEKRPYHPHITLAKNWLSGESGAWRSTVCAAAEQSWIVDKIVLYSIWPGQVPEYHPEGVFSLKLP